MIHFLMHTLVFMGALLAVIVVGIVLIGVLWLIVNEVIETYRLYKLEKNDEV